MQNLQGGIAKCIDCTPPPAHCVDTTASHPSPVGAFQVRFPQPATAASSSSRTFHRLSLIQNLPFCLLYAKLPGSGATRTQIVVRTSQHTLIEYVHAKPTSISSWVTYSVYILHEVSYGHSKQPADVHRCVSQSWPIKYF